MIVLDPLADASAGPPGDGLAARLPSLSGAGIAFVDNGWETLDGLFDKIGQLLQRRHGTTVVAHVESHDTIADERVQALLPTTTAAIVGLGN